MQLICLGLILVMHTLFAVDRIEFSQKALDELKEEAEYDVEHREVVIDLVPIFVEEDLLGVLFLLENGKVWLSDDGRNNEGLYLEKGNEVIFTPERRIIYPLGISKKMGWGDEQFLGDQSVQFIGSFKDAKGVSKTVIDIKEGRTFFDDGTSFAFEDQIDIGAIEGFKNNVCDFSIPSILKKVFLFEPLQVGDKVVAYEFALAEEAYAFGFFRKQILTWFEKTSEKERISWREPKIFSEKLLQEVENRGIFRSQKKIIVDVFPAKASVKMPRHKERIIEAELILLDSAEFIQIQIDDSVPSSYSLQFEAGDELFLVQNASDEAPTVIIPEQYQVLELEACFSCKNQEDSEILIKAITSISKDGYAFDDGSVLLFSELFQIPAHFSGSYHDNEWETTTYWDSTWGDQGEQLAIEIGYSYFYTEESLERFSRNFSSGERIEHKILCSRKLLDVFKPQSFRVGDTVSIYKMKGVSKPNESLLGLPEGSCFMLMRKI